MARTPPKPPQDIGRRNAALLSLDRDTILAYLWDALDPAEYERFANAPLQSFWRMIHMTRLFVRSLPAEARAESHAWLMANRQADRTTKKD